MQSHRIGAVSAASAICLGTGAFGSQVGQDAADALLDRFAERGGSCLDSAHIYGAWDPQGLRGGCGNSETAIGSWLRRRGCRDRMVICTKGGHPDFATGASRLDRTAILQQLDESLDHLGMPTIDVYFLHRDDRAIPVAEILDWFREPLADGRIRALAASNWRADRLQAASEAADRLGAPRLAASQISWSLAHVADPFIVGTYGEQVAMEDAALAFHRRTGMPVMAYNAQAGGFIARFAVSEAALRAPGAPKPGLLRRYGSERSFARLRLATACAARHGCSLNQYALAWLLAQPFPTLPIIGPSTVAHLDESLAALSVAITADEVHLLHET